MIYVVNSPLWGNVIKKDVFKLLVEAGELLGTLTAEEGQEPRHLLELEGFQLAFFKLFSRPEPI